MKRWPCHPSLKSFCTQLHPSHVVSCFREANYMTAFVTGSKESWVHWQSKRQEFAVFIWWWWRIIISRFIWTGENRRERTPDKERFVVIFTHHNASYNNLNTDVSWLDYVHSFWGVLHNRLSQLENHIFAHIMNSTLHLRITSRKTQQLSTVDITNIHIAVEMSDLCDTNQWHQEESFFWNRLGTNDRNTEDRT